MTDIIIVTGNGIVTNKRKKPSLITSCRLEHETVSVTVATSKAFGLKTIVVSPHSCYDSVLKNVAYKLMSSRFLSTETLSDITYKFPNLKGVVVECDDKDITVFSWTDNPDYPHSDVSEIKIKMKQDWFISGSPHYLKKINTNLKEVLSSGSLEDIAIAAKENGLLTEPIWFNF